MVQEVLENIMARGHFKYMDYKFFDLEYKLVVAKIKSDNRAQAESVRAVASLAKAKLAMEKRRPNERWDLEKLKVDMSKLENFKRPQDDRRRELLASVKLRSRRPRAPTTRAVPPRRTTSCVGYSSKALSIRGRLLKRRRGLSTR